MRRCFVLALLFLGSSVVSAQEPFDYFHYKPKDHVIGDVHPYFHKGECYLYSLVPRTFDIELAQSKDLLNWKSAPVKHDPPKPDEWKSPYYVLGVFHDPKANIFRSFYSLAGGKGRIVSSTSPDLLNWSCAPKEFTIPPGDHYLRRRDPYVFWIPESNEYGCVMCTQLKSKAGAVSLATSPDLRTWKPEGEIYNPGTGGEPECPQMFRLANRWYMLTSLYDRGVGQPSYWKGENPRGPWTKRTGVLDGKDLCAGQIAFDGDRAVLFGWIPLTPTPAGVKQYWGGHLALPREVYAFQDGTLGTRLHPGVAKIFSAIPAATWDDLRIDAKPLAIQGDWDRAQFEFRVTMPEDCPVVHFGLDSLGEVILNRTDKTLAIRDLNGKVGTIVPAGFAANKALPLRIVVDGDIIEVFLNDRYSLAARMPKPKGPSRFTMHTGGGTAQITQLRAAKIPGASAKP